MCCSELGGRRVEEDGEAVVAGVGVGEGLLLLVLCWGFVPYTGDGGARLLPEGDTDGFPGN